MEIWKWLLAYSIAIISDSLDYLAFFIFQIPIIGDVADLLTIGILWYSIGNYAFIGIGELVPALDFLPTHTGSVLFAMLARYWKT